MKEYYSDRGFKQIEFKDQYDKECYLSKSSLVDEQCIWLGLRSQKAQITAIDAIKLGLPTNGKTVGWVDYDMPKEVFVGTSMHLSRDMVEQLLPALHRFVDTGEL